MSKAKNCFLNGWKTIIFYKSMDLVHAFMTFLSSWRIKKSFNGFPKRILISNWGALGDVVLSSGVVAEIKSRFPECKIGFIVSKDSKIVLETYEKVDWIHEVESWIKPNRGKFQKKYDLLKFIFVEQPKYVKEIASIGYDCAIELRPFFPNIIPVFWKAGIPCRVGFTSSGNGGLLSLPVEWSNDQYLPHSYWDLLEKIGITRRSSDSLMPRIFLKETPSLRASKPYLIFHLCSSDKVKEMPSKFWRELHQECINNGLTVYFTGRGLRETQAIKQVINNDRFDFSNKLSWNELVQHIRDSAGIVSVDSVPVHLAASFGTPCIVLFKETSSPAIWNPNIPSVTAFGVSKPIQVDEVFEVIKKWNQIL